MSNPAKQIHLACGVPGVNNQTVWSDPAAVSQIEFSTFRHVTQTAERANFDFSSWLRGCACASNEARSTTWTSWAGRIRSRCWPPWLP
jgi:hypothetical protein